MKFFPGAKSLLLVTYGVMIGLLMGGVLWIVSSPPRGNPVTLATRSSVQFVTAYISGEVVNPGVYQIPHGSRVKDLVEIAGGFLTSADVSKVNMAAIVTDSSHLNIISLMAIENIQNSLININTASQSELETLPGIGPVLAKYIIDYRLESGPFKRTVDIQSVPGIGPQTFDEIKDFITIGD